MDGFVAGPAGEPLSSRSSRVGAGWTCTEPGSDAGEVPDDLIRATWFSPRTWVRSRNQPLTKLSDPVAQWRQEWVGDATDSDLVVDLSARLGPSGQFSFLVLGDTGEGDHSQWALRRRLIAEADGCAFAFICSDVLYPGGDICDYEDKFYRPYADVMLPIYAVPGNHDWYDGLAGFMFHLCGRQAVPEPPVAGWRSRLRRLLWRRSPDPDPDELARMRSLRGSDAQRHPVQQPGPYFVIDTPHLRLVCIDTGIKGQLDAGQAAWLVRVSSDPRPKILLTGRPLVVDNVTMDCPLAGCPEGFCDVRQVVDHERFRYVAVIGGDVHNYQHYPVRANGRTMHHVVSGGGGAFLHATHYIPTVDVLGVHEDEFRCYPWRRDSMAAFSEVASRSLKFPALRLTTQQSRAVLSLNRPRGADRADEDDGQVSVVSWWARAVGSLLLRVGGRRTHALVSPYHTWDAPPPPMFKHFLRVDVTGDAATVTCLGVHGCAEHEGTRLVEDRFTATLGGGPA